MRCIREYIGQPKSECQSTQEMRRCIMKRNCKFPRVDIWHRYSLLGLAILYKPHHPPKYFSSQKIFLQTGNLPSVISSSVITHQLMSQKDEHKVRETLMMFIMIHHQVGMIGSNQKTRMTHLRHAGGPWWVNCDVTTVMFYCPSVRNCIRVGWWYSKPLTLQHVIQ